MRRIRVLALCCAVLLILSLSAVQAQVPPPQRGGTIRVGITQEIINLDPHVATAFSSFQVMDLVYESLLRLNAKTLEVEPNLATSWSVSADGLEYTFTLRRDATFHDGTTVRIALKRPFAPFLSLLTRPSRGIVPVNFEDKVGDARVRTLGSGPYRLAEFGPGSVRLTRYERYWRRDAQGNRLPHADAVIYRVIPDPATLRAAVRAGEVDLIIGFGVDINAARTLDAVPGLKVMSVADLAYSLLGIQHERPPFNDARVKQALALAIDRAQLIQVVYSGRATAAGPLPPTAAEWRPVAASGLPNYRRDAIRARQLLAQAGHPNGVAIKMLPIPTVPEVVQIAQVLKEQLAPAGFNVEIEQVDFATFLSRWRGSQFDTFVSLNSGEIDPDVHLYRHIHSTGSTNVFKFKDSSVDQLLDQGRGTPDIARRQQIYGQLQRQIAEKVPFLFLAYADLFAVARANVNGFTLSSTRSMWPLAETWLAR